MRWLLALLCVLRGASMSGKPCEEPTEFSPPDKKRRDRGSEGWCCGPDARVNCQCHGPEEEQVTSLLHSDENKARFGCMTFVLKGILHRQVCMATVCLARWFTPS